MYNIYIISNFCDTQSFMLYSTVIRTRHLFDEKLENYDAVKLMVEKLNEEKEEKRGVEQSKEN